jgi:hypothetical protein
VCFVAALVTRPTPTRHFGLEAAAWYWHFLDVVWLWIFLFAPSGRDRRRDASVALRIIRSLHRLWNVGADPVDLRP